MRRVATLAAAVLASILLAAPAHAYDVTGSGVVQRDLHYAVRYFAKIVPGSRTSCPGVSFAVTSMGPAEGAGGFLRPASEVLAETRLGACEIRLSALLWSIVTSRSRWESAMGCRAIEHEYGHVLGYPDTRASSGGVMDEAGWTAGWKSPCDFIEHPALRRRHRH